MGLSMGEIILIIAVILLLFGAEKLPSLARSLGKAMKEFKQGIKEGADGEPDPKPGTQNPRKKKTGKKKK